MSYSLNICIYSIMSVVLLPPMFRFFDFEQKIYIPIIIVFVFFCNFILTSFRFNRRVLYDVIAIGVLCVFCGFFTYRSLPVFSIGLFVLCLIISFQFFDALGRLDDIGRERFILFFGRISFFLLLFGVYQFFANGFGLPFSSADFDFRGRGQGFSKQITSVFEEPAFYGLFLLSTLVSIDKFRLSFWSRTFFFILILFNVFLSKSIISFGGFLVFLFLFVLRFIKLAVCRWSVSNFQLFVVLFLVMMSFAFVFSFDSFFSFSTFSRLLARLDYEFFSQLINVASLSRGSIDGSGALRTLGEYFDFVFVFEQSPLTGLGFAYDDLLPHRISALNAYVEFFVRFGVFGFLIILGIVRQIPFNFNLNSFVILNFYFFSDGAIVKFSFWVVLALSLFMSSVSTHGGRS